jgi:hypothetical protein
MSSNDSESKKIRGKLLERSQGESGNTKVVVDTVFSGRVELLFTEKSSGVIPETGTWVNVTYTTKNPLTVTRIWSDDQSESESSAQETPVPRPREKQEPKGPVRSMRGELVSASVNETAGGRLGSVTVKIRDFDVNLIVGGQTTGEIPSVGTYAAIEFEDTEVPRALHIERTDDTSLLEPIYTPVPRAPWLVRWPVACMSCGETDFSKLDYREEFWTTNLEKPKVVEGTAMTVLKVVNAIMITSLTPALGEVKRKKKYLSVALPILMYRCKDCKKQNVKLDDCVDISLEPIENSKLRYHFEFESPKYEEYFRDHNPTDIEPKIDVNER